MSETSPNLNLPYLLPSQAQKHVTHNLALQILDAVAQMCLEGVDAVVPPAVPFEGETWAIGANATEAWAGHADEIAIWTNGSWMFLPLRDGLIGFDKSSGSLVTRTGGAWISPGGLGSPSILGVNATADTTNRLSVAADATLFSNVGAGHQLKLNKASANDTAALLYQTGFSGRAEMGLAGNDDWSLKVSPDGATWLTSLQIDASNGHVSGQSVQSGASDIGAGKLARADYVYGPGNVLGPVGESAGLPTGAVIEHGTGTDGRFTRFADGTQICQTSGADFTHAEDDFLRNIWTFPAAFSEPPTVTPTLSRALSDYTDVAILDLGQTTSNFSTTNVVMELYRVAGASAFLPSAEVRNVRITAIGRWY